MIAYEQKLKSDINWALRETGRHFEEASLVHKTLKQIVKRLDEVGISYAVVGGMAMYMHGLRRFTIDVDLLVRRDGAGQMIEQLKGLGYYLDQGGTGIKLRDVDTGVRIKFLFAGDYPGDGKQNVVAYPDPAGATVEIGGMKILVLPALVELKLAAGIPVSYRLKSLADAQELIRALKLPRNFGDQLNPYVRPKFDELWAGVAQSPNE
jgi:hypothetical protein